MMLFYTSSLMQISVENGRIMTLTRNIIFLLFCATNIWAHSLADLESNDLNEGDYENNIRDDKRIRVQLYYDSLGYDSMNFYKFPFYDVIKSVERYVEVETYPFGNSKVIQDNGKVSFECPHGPDECYGNKLHACALFIHGPYGGLDFNHCLMSIANKNTDGSDDEAADMCGQELHLDPSEIKDCAKSTHGTKLLLYYADQTKKTNFSYVPHLLIKGQMYYPGYSFFHDLCAAFDTKPPSCQKPW